MNSHGGRRIVRLVKMLTAVALIAGAITLAMVGWTLAQVRSQRALATAEQTRLSQESDELRRLAVEAEKETAFDENFQPTPRPRAVSHLVNFVHSLLGSRPDSLVLDPLQRIEAQMSRLSSLSDRGNAWQARYHDVSLDTNHDRTVGKVRHLIANLRGSVEESEGRIRLDKAIQFNRARKAAAQGGAVPAAAPFLEQSASEGQDLPGFSNDLAELTRLTEMLNGETQLDRLPDLKDNKLKSIFDSLNGMIGMFGSDVASTSPITHQAIKKIEAAVFGDGYVTDDAQQNIQPGHGGLFALRERALELAPELANLQSEQGDIFRSIEADNAKFAQMAQLRTIALAQQMERSLTVGWRQSLIFGACSATLFLWLAWLITRGIGGQVVALEERTAELTRQITQRERAEQDVRLLQNRQEIICNVIGEGIYWIDAEGCITFGNPAAAHLLGWETADLLGRQAHAAVHHTHADGTAYPRDDCPVYVAMQTGAMCHVDDEVFWRKDGTAIPVEYTTTPVRDNNGQVMGAVVVFTNIAERKRAAADLERTNGQLRDISRRAGMAEVATGVLHNVGNVLNSVNVSSTLIANALRKLKVGSLARIAAVLREHEQDLGAFLTTDARGKMLPGFLTQLAGHLTAKQGSVLKELAHLQNNIEHIKEIVYTQQAHASSAGIIESVDLRELLEAALRMNTASLRRHEIVVVREFQDLPPVPVDKHKVLQILVNLITNARQAMKDRAEKTLTLGIQATAEGSARISLRDTGCGIAVGNVTRVFAHGFTTKKDGHGFGLHSSALAAMEMKGSLTVQSDGPGRGAIFTLELPLAESRLIAA